MKLKLWIGGYLAAAIATVVVWLCLGLSHPLVDLLVVAFWIASEVVTGWGLSRWE